MDYFQYIIYYSLTWCFVVPYSVYGAILALAS